jgi:hypothetical protein
MGLPEKSEQGFIAKAPGQFFLLPCLPAKTDPDENFSG